MFLYKSSSLVFVTLFPFLLIVPSFVFGQHKVSNSVQSLDKPDSHASYPDTKNLVEMEESIIKYPLPLTPVKLGQPCDLTAYKAFFKEKGKTDSAFDTLTVLLEESYYSETVNETKSIPFREKLGEICIEIDSFETIDTFKYDCIPKTNSSTKGVCTCGQIYSMVDTHMPVSSVVQDKMRIYYGVFNLDRKLVEESGVCVSGPNGHCTLPENINSNSISNSTLEIMKCLVGHICTWQDYPERLHNKKTLEAFGICQIKTQVDYMNEISLANLLKPTIINLVFVKIIINTLFIII